MRLLIGCVDDHWVHKLEQVERQTQDPRFGRGGGFRDAGFGRSPPGGPNEWAPPGRRGSEEDLDDPLGRRQGWAAPGRGEEWRPPGRPDDEEDGPRRQGGGGGGGGRGAPPGRRGWGDDGGFRGKPL